MIKASSEKCRVLIVDDDQKICALLSELIEHEGYEVLSADDGSGALELIHAVDPDVVISDVVMPIVDGIELCKRIKHDSRTSDIPVLLISGERNALEDSLEGLTAGADDYLHIPFRNEELLVKVARLAERRRVENLYRGIVEDAADIIYTRDMDGCLTSINAAGAKFFGKSSEEIVGSHLSSLIGEAAAARDIEETRLAATNLPLRSTYCIDDTEENGRYLEGVITIERDRQGRPTGIRGVVRDITDQKLAESALIESEERYRRLVELSPEGIVIHSEGKFVYLNPAAQHLWGASSPEELIGRSIMDVVHPDSRDIVMRRLRDLEERGSATELNEQKHVKLNGEVIDVEVAGMPFVFRGKPAVQAVIRDITDRRRGREALRQTEARLRMVVGGASIVIFSLDKDGIFTLSEGEGLRALGLKSGEVVGRSVFDVYRDDPDMLDSVRRALAGEAFCEPVEIGRLTFETRYTPVTDDANNVVGVIGVATDIT